MKRRRLHASLFSPRSPHGPSSVSTPAEQQPVCEQHSGQVPDKHVQAQPLAEQQLGLLQACEAGEESVPSTLRVLGELES